MFMFFKYYKIACDFGFLKNSSKVELCGVNNERLDLYYRTYHNRGIKTGTYIKRNTLRSDDVTKRGTTFIRPIYPSAVCGAYIVQCEIVPPRILKKHVS